MEEIIQTTVSSTIQEVINNANLLYFDKITMILSIIAIVISIWSVIWTARKNNKSNYKNNLYEDILEKALNKELPIYIQKSIDINCKKTNEKEINEFEEFLMQLRKNILVFKYVDNKFYNKIDKTIIKIDDNLVLISTKKNEFDLKYAELIKEIKNLYKLIEKYLFK